MCSKSLFVLVLALMMIAMPTHAQDWLDCDLLASAPTCYQSYKDAFSRYVESMWNPVTSTYDDAVECTVRVDTWQRRWNVINPGSAREQIEDECSELASCIPACWTIDPPPNEPEDEGGQPGSGSPIAVDMDGGGFRFTSIANGAYFDIDGSGDQESVSWIEPGDPWLVMDRNDDGSITGGPEMFGNFTPMSDGSTAPHGYAALAEMDSDGNGRVDESDQPFHRLALWYDDGDGLTELGELAPLPAGSVLYFDFVESRARDRHGNILRYRSRANIDGRMRQTVDVFLLVEND